MAVRMAVYREGYIYGYIHGLSPPDHLADELRPVPGDMHALDQADGKRIRFDLQSNVRSTCEVTRAAHCTVRSLHQPAGCRWPACPPGIVLGA